MTNLKSMVANAFRYRGIKHLPRMMWGRFWWRYIPGVTVKVKWPVGEIVVDHNDPRWYDIGGAARIKFESADPNDHYRPWMEANIGRQGWDWDWKLRDDDVSENMLTIRIRKKHEKQATEVAMRWS